MSRYATSAGIRLRRNGRAAARLALAMLPLAGLTGTAHAQQFSKSTSEDIAGWTMLPRMGITRDNKIVGDFNGDGRDDIFWEYNGLVGGSPTSMQKIWTGDAATAQWKLHYDGGTAQTISPLNAPAITIPGTIWRYVAGDFVGVGNTAELLMWASDKTSNATYSLFNWQASGRPSLVVDGRNGRIGGATINSGSDPTKRAKLFAANLTSDWHDELFSLEFISPTQIMVRIQAFQPMGIPDNFVNVWNNGGGQWLGGWALNWDADAFYFGDFIGADGVDELLCINRSNGWIKLLKFTGTAWQELYTNMGNFNFYQTPVTGSSYLFNTATSIVVNNFDGDSRVEVLAYQGSLIGSVKSMEFDPATLKFKPVKAPAFDASGVAGDSQSSSHVETTHYWSDRRCVRKFLGICREWAGGAHMDGRWFWSRVKQNGSLDVLAGNFDVAADAKRELMVFYNSTLYPNNIASGITFVTSCPGQPIHPAVTPCSPYLQLYDLSGRYLNTYDFYNDMLIDGAAPRNTRRTTLISSGDL